MGYKEDSNKDEKLIQCLSVKEMLVITRFEITIENFHYSHCKWQNYAEYLVLL